MLRPTCSTISTYAFKGADGFSPFHATQASVATAGLTGRNTTFLCGSFFSCSGTRATPKPAEMAWIIVRSRSTSCKTFGIIEASDDVLEDGIVDLELGREIVRRFDAVSLLLKIKQTGAVTLVGFAQELR